MRLLTVDGRPLATRRVHVLPALRDRAFAATTDADGWLMLDPAPAGEVALELHAGDLDDDAYLRLSPAERASRTTLLGRVRADTACNDTSLQLRAAPAVHAPR